MISVSVYNLHDSLYPLHDINIANNVYSFIIHVFESEARSIKDITQYTTHKHRKTEAEKEQHT